MTPDVSMIPAVGIIIMAVHTVAAAVVARAAPIVTRSPNRADLAASSAVREAKGYEAYSLIAI